MTQQADAPMTRRALRAARANALPAADAPVTGPEMTPPTHSLAPMTRRALREAERALAAAVPNQAAPAVPSQATAPPVEARTSLVPAPTPVPPVLGSVTPLLTRRELRTAAQQPRSHSAAADSPNICRPPFAASLVLPAQQVRASQARAVISRLGARPLAVVALSFTVLMGGITQVYSEQSSVAAEIAAAEAYEVERAERVERVSAARNAAQAAAFAAGKRTEALALAEEAVGTAQGVKAKAADVVDQDTLAALERATAELTELLQSAPAVEALSAVVPPEQVSTQTPIVADEVTETTDANAEAERSTPATDTPDAEVSTKADPSAPSADVSVTDPARAARPTRADVASRAGADDAHGRAPVAERAEQAGSEPGDQTESDTAAAKVLGSSDTAMIEQQLAALDIDTSTRILAAANEVAALSAQVEATADTILAEIEAQRAAEEAARQAAEEAARQAAEEMARKVAVVKDAPNGQVPADVLCGVAFHPNVQLRCDAAAALERLNEAYKADFGRDLRVVSSYRSYSAQVSTKQTRGYLAATPGTSNHGRGIAVDFGDFGGVGNFGSANHRWMRAHGPEFGWHHPAIMRPGGGGPQEPWHFEFED